MDVFCNRKVERVCKARIDFRKPNAISFVVESQVMGRISHHDIVECPSEHMEGAQNLRFIGFGYAAWDSSWRINHGSVFVDTAATANGTLLQRFVIHHEFMHTLGFTGHVIVPGLSSIMFPSSLPPYLLDYTDYDKRMIRLLYNLSVTSGINET